MSIFRIYVSQGIPEIGIKYLQQASDVLEVVVHDGDHAPTELDLIHAFAHFDGILCLLTDEINQVVLEAATRVRVISNYAVGYNNIDVDYATQKGIMVTNTPGVLTETTADMAFAMLLAVARRIPESDQFVRQGLFKGWGAKLLLGTDVAGKTIGIIGGGRIGLAMAKRALGFDMKVLYMSRSTKMAFENLGAKFSNLTQLLKESDFISIHTDLNPSTHHLLGYEEFQQMKNTAYLINTARGAVIHEHALVHALDTKEIAGAALDVFEFEPLIHPKLLDMPNVVLCPHTGSATTETRNKMAMIAAQNLLTALRGETPKHLVNHTVLNH